ncbi:MAG: sigma-70 family RNA polymerase sigma factor [Planctomycetes bacterium]|nr:sigma-70 family RNA polymerase sigma factor [Planctomycetota bacterium]
MSDSSPSIILRDCLAKARAGDPLARDRLFAACRSYLGLLARASVEPWMQAKIDASDLVQQTMLDAHRDFQHFQGQTDQEWLGWLRQILNHNACDAARHYGVAGKRAARREVPMAGIDNSGSVANMFEPQSPGGSPSQMAINHETELLLAEAMDQLPDDYREVIILRNIQRLPFETVAEQMQRTRAATQMLWMRAIQKLKSLLSVPGVSGISGAIQ